MDSHWTSQKAVIIHLLRHAETEHKSNDSETVDKTIVDPMLNDQGMEHCKRRCTYLKCTNSHITHILSSPLSRGLQTSWLTFKDAVTRGVQIYAIPELQSLGTGPNGTGLDMDELKSLWLQHGVNFDYMVPDWNSKKQKRRIGWDKPKWRNHALRTTVADMLDPIRNGTPQGRIEFAIVGHSSFLVDLAGGEDCPDCNDQEMMSFIMNENGSLNRIWPDELHYYRLLQGKICCCPSHCPCSVGLSEEDTSVDLSEVEPEMFDRPEPLIDLTPIEDRVDSGRSGEVIEQHSLTIYDLLDDCDTGKSFWVEDSPLRWQ